MMKNTLWKMNPIEDVYESENSPDLHPIILKLLKKRGVVSKDQITRFLDPKIEYLYNPGLMKDMDEAVKRIRKAIIENEKITVYGDYDVDGITSTCIMVKTLRKMGAKVDYYIPSRIEEGYGLNISSLEKIHDEGTTLVITVDNGISCFEEIDYAKSLGIDVIVTDHHEPQDRIPQALAVINPKQSKCTYPFKELAGVGIALKLVHALTDLNPETLIDNLDLAALGTIADMVPLLDENRIIVKQGLAQLEKTKNKGLKAMKSLLNLSEGPLDVNKVSFLLAPRLNAAGRISSAKIAIDLLLNEDESEALELAKTLESINQERQSIEAEILAQAKEMVERDMNFDEDQVIVAFSEEWHPGVIGIVASKLVELYHRPCILIAVDKDEGKGSGRSIPGFNLFEALSRLSHLLIRYGGHEQAAGLAININKINIFKKEINEFARETIKPIDLTPAIDIDMELKEEDLTLELAKQIELLEPFGYGNPKPVFMCRNFCINHMKTVGNDDKHLKMSLKKKHSQLSAIGFNFGLYKDEINLAPLLDIAFYLEVNRWQGHLEPQLNIKDIKFPYIQDELLTRLEDGYYRRFFSISEEAMHETVLPVDFALDIDRNRIIKKTEIDKNDYIKNLFEQGRKVIVMVNTPYQAWRLMLYLKGKEKIKNKTKALFSIDPSVEEGRKNIILINPIDITFKESVDDVVFYDAPFSKEIFTRRLKSIPLNSKIHIIFKNSDIRYNYLVCQKVLPDVEEIRKIYKLIMDISQDRPKYRSGLNDFKALLRKVLDLDLHYIGLINVLKVFKEMGIMDVKIKNGFFEIEKYKLKSKVKLENSCTYRKISSIKKKVKEFEQLEGEYNW